MKNFLWLALLLSGLIHAPACLFAQPVNKPLTYRPDLDVRRQPSKIQALVLHQAQAATDTVYPDSIPFSEIDLYTDRNGFIDDFSAHNFVPDPVLWKQGGGSTISRTAAVNPPTLNTVVFDNFNQKGLPYSNALINSGGCDTLTSRHLTGLETLAFRDSIYLSFFWQAGGFVPQSEPDATDSLVLQFWSQTDSQWVSVWNALGLDSTTAFNYVLLKVDSLYLPRFAFRFINFGSRTGVSFDAWNLDYVYVNYVHRTAHRDLQVNPGGIRDLFISGIPPGLLKHYTAIPYNQAIAGTDTQFRDSAAVYVRNFQRPDPFPTPFPTRALLSNRQNGQAIYSKDNLPSLYQNTDASIAIPSAQLSLTDYLKAYGRPVALRSRYAVTSTDGANRIRSNDSVNCITDFANFYAYDDGTPELSRSVGGNNAFFVYRFNLKTADTLTHIGIYFPRTYQNQRPEDSTHEAFRFRLAVLKRATPDSSFNDISDVYRRQDAEVAFDTTNQNGGYTVYKLNLPVKLPPGPVYIGYQQGVGIANILEVGLDLNNTNGGNAFYNYAGTWEADTGHWALMVRPWFGEKPYLGLPESPAPKAPVTLYPNPAKGLFRLEGGVKSASVTDLSGRTCEVNFNSEGANHLSADVSGLAAGLYLVKCSLLNGSVQVLKLVVE